jgi:hypothetical protein
MADQKHSPEFVALMNELYSSKRLPRDVRAEFDAYEQGYRDAIADVVAMLHGIGRTEACAFEEAKFADRIKARIERGDANGSRHG